MIPDYLSILAKILYIKKIETPEMTFWQRPHFSVQAFSGSAFFPHPRDVSLPPPGGRSASQTETANSCQN